MRRLSWITVASIAWMGGCTIIAGLDGDYLVGDVGTGGAGNNNPVGGSPPGSGGENTGATTTTMSTGANGGTMQSGGAGGMGGSLGGGGDGGTIGPGGTGGTGGDGPTFLVACPGDICVKGEVCCVSPTAGNPSSGCGAPGGCSINEIQIACDGPEDCDPGDVCCGTHIGYYTSVVCVAAGTCTAIDEFTMCWGDNPGNQNCPMSQTCFPSSSLPGFGYCD